MELWHHLPRAQAVAAALSAGRSSVAAGAAGQDGGGSAGGEREVFLGSASGPLLDVLRKPQVGGCCCCCWYRIFAPTFRQPCGHCRGTQLASGLAKFGRAQAVIVCSEFCTPRDLPCLCFALLWPKHGAAATVQLCLLSQRGSRCALTSVYS